MFLKKIFGEVAYSEAKLLAISLALSISFIGFLLFHYMIVPLMGLNIPFFLESGQRFTDMSNVLRMAAAPNPYETSAFGTPTYFPFTFYLLSFFKTISPVLGTLYILVGILIATAIMAALWARRITRRENWLLWALPVFVTLTFNFPFIFAVDRGNIEMLIVLLYLGFVYGLLHERRGLASLCLGVAAAMKGYPVLFLLLAIGKKDFKTVAGSLSVFVVLTLLALQSLTGDISTTSRGFMAGLKTYEANYVLGSSGNWFFIEPYSLLKTFIYHGQLPFSHEALYKVYPFFSFGALVLISIMVVFSTREYYLKVAMVGIGIILFPRLANDYKMVVLLPAIFVFLLQQKPQNKDMEFLLFMIALLVPKTIFLGGRYTLGCLINPLLITWFLVWGLWHNWRDTVSNLLRFRFQGIPEEILSRTADCPQQ